MLAFWLGINGVQKEPGNPLWHLSLQSVPEVLSNWKRSTEMPVRMACLTRATHWALHLVNWIQTKMMMQGCHQRSFLRTLAWIFWSMLRLKQSPGLALTRKKRLKVMRRPAPSLLNMQILMEYQIVVNLSAWPMRKTMQSPLGLRLLDHRTGRSTWRTTICQRPCPTCSLSKETSGTNSWGSLSTSDAPRTGSTAASWKTLWHAAKLPGNWPGTSHWGLFNCCIYLSLPLPIFYRSTNPLPLPTAFLFVRVNAIDPWLSGTMSICWRNFGWSRTMTSTKRGRRV